MSIIKSKQQVLDYLYNGYFDGSNLPPFYKATGFKNLNFIPFTDSATKPKYTKPVHYYAPKSSTKLREFTLIHPYSYWHLANTLAGEGFELMISKLNSRNKITSYGVLADASQSFNEWERGMEIDLPSKASLYSFMVVSDVSTFYKSIYTHSLSWALHGKDFIKNNRRDFNLLGNRIDYAFQKCMDEQTNGLPVGNAASHLASELILKDIDEKISQQLSHLDFLGFRFRDDYRFLTRTKDGARTIIKTLDQLLQKHYGMQLNDEKTDIHDDIIGNCYRPWKGLVRNNSTLARVDALTSSDDLESLFKLYNPDGVFLSIYNAQLQTKYRLAPSMLEKVARYLLPSHFKDYQNRLYAIQSVLESIVDLKEESTPQFAKIITVLVNSISLPSAKQEMLMHVVRQPRLEKLSEQQLTWMYRMLMTFGHENLITLDHPLIKILDDSEYECDASLFAMPDQLIHDELHKKYKMIDREIFQSLKEKEIGQNERNVFYNMSL